MRALILIAGAALAVTACRPAEPVDNAVVVNNTAGDANVVNAPPTCANGQPYDQEKHRCPESN